MRPIGESHPTRVDDDHQVQAEEVKRRITMYVFRDGCLYQAACNMTYDAGSEGTHEWMASAIALMDISVDMAEAQDAESTG